MGRRREPTRGRVDEGTIRIACRLVNYDVVYRAGPQFYNPDAPTAPDQTTVDHISAMVERSMEFFRGYGPITLDRFTFEGAYRMRSRAVTETSSQLTRFGTSRSRRPRRRPITPSNCSFAT
jgi:hypothetical protein